MATSSAGTLSNINITGKFKPEGSYNYVGALVGWSTGVVNSCNILANAEIAITASESAGGMIGRADASVSNCQMNLNKVLSVTASGSYAGGSYAGGMIGLVRDLSICLDLYSQQKEEEK